MAFCVNCGTKIEEEVKFCPGCGTQVMSAGLEIKQEKAINIIQTQPSALPAAASYNQNTAAADEKFCFSCGSVIKKAAEICPKCGVNQSSRAVQRQLMCIVHHAEKQLKKKRRCVRFAG
jgi:RNA polymerase subunit RPABC4/transcription elongation factor Spt4